VLPGAAGAENAGRRGPSATSTAGSAPARPVVPFAAGPRVVCIVPARNEAERIATTVTTLLGVRGLDRVVVVDDGSTDGTAAAATSAGASVLSLTRRVGKGGAVEAALDRFAMAGFYVLVDADVGASAGGVAPLLDVAQRGRSDLAIGRLPPQGAGGFGIVKSMARRLIALASGFSASEPLSGQRAVRGDVLRACRPLAAGFGIEVAMTIDAVRLGARVAELDVEMHHRATGRSLGGFAHRARQGLDMLSAAIPRIVRLR
jgi:glycosyltransferase involved in cell wall biosynthesis